MKKNKGKKKKNKSKMKKKDNKNIDINKNNFEKDISFNTNQIGYSIIKSVECVIHYPNYDYIVDKFIKCEKCDNFISVKYNNDTCMNCIYRELFNIYDYYN
jgi:hypothetical protein